MYTQALLQTRSETAIHAFKVSKIAKTRERSFILAKLQIENVEKLISYAFSSNCSATVQQLELLYTARQTHKPTDYRIPRLRTRTEV